MYPAYGILPYKFSLCGIDDKVTSAPLFCSIHPQVELLTWALYPEPSFSLQGRRNIHIKQLAQYERK